MRLFLCLAALLTVAASPVLAGSLTYADGKGTWAATDCVRPEKPDLLPSGETPAKNMNKRIEAYNLYAAKAKSYMDCVTQEAAHDATAAQQTIAQTAQEMVQEVQKDAEAARPQVKKK